MDIGTGNKIVSIVASLWTVWQKIFRKVLAVELRE